MHLKKKSRTARQILLPLAALLALLIGLGLTIRGGDRIFPNIRIDGVAVGRLTREEALSRLDTAGYRARSVTPLTVSACGTSVRISPVEAGLLDSAEQAADTALAFGRNGGVLRCLGKYLSCLVSGAELGRAEAPDEAVINAKINELSAGAAA